MKKIFLALLFIGLIEDVQAQTANNCPCKTAVRTHKAVVTAKHLKRPLVKKTTGRSMLALNYKNATAPCVAANNKANKVTVTRKLVCTKETIMKPDILTGSLLDPVVTPVKTVVCEEKLFVNGKEVKAVDETNTPQTIVEEQNTYTVPANYTPVENANYTPCTSRKGLIKVSCIQQ